MRNKVLTSPGSSLAAALLALIRPTVAMATATCGRWHSVQRVHILLAQCLLLALWCWHLLPAHGLCGSKILVSPLQVCTSLCLACVSALVSFCASLQAVCVCVAPATDLGCDPGQNLKQLSCCSQSPRMLPRWSRCSAQCSLDVITTAALQSSVVGQPRAPVWCCDGKLSWSMSMLPPHLGVMVFEYTSQPRSFM